MSLLPQTSVNLKANILFSRLLDSGYYSGAYKICNVTQVGPQAQAGTTDSIKGTELCNYNQDLDTQTVPGTTQFSMQCNQFDENNLELAFLGTKSSLASASVNITAYGAYFGGGMAHLNHSSVTASSIAAQGYTLTVGSSTGFAANDILTEVATGIAFAVVSSTTGTTLVVFKTVPGYTFTGGNVTNGTSTVNVTGVATKNDIAALTTDFTYDATCLSISKVAAGKLDLSNLTNLVLNYTYARPASMQINVGTNTIIKGKIEIIGNNVFTLKPVYALFRQVALTPDQIFSFINAATGGGASGRATASWTGTLEKPAGAADLGYAEWGI